MFINENNLYTDLSDINTLRYLLIRDLYIDKNYIEILINIISKCIEVLSYEYDPASYTITIKIKKTSMRKNFGNKFTNNPAFYYQLMPNIFAEFLNINKENIIRSLSSKYDDPISAYDYIMLKNHKYGLLNNLCHISCFSDNIIYIKL